MTDPKALLNLLASGELRPAELTPGDEVTLQGEVAGADVEHLVAEIVAAWVTVKRAGLAYDDHMDPEVAALAALLDRLEEVVCGW